MLPWIVALLLSKTACAEPAAQPSGLLCDYQTSPALGVRRAPAFSWIVPPCAGAPDQQQQAYQLVVLAANTGAVVWDSGKTAGNDSTYAAYVGPLLALASRFTWTVTTRTQSCTSPASRPSTFVTAPGNWSSAARFISTPTSATFGYFRKEVTVPAGGYVSAVAYVAAAVDGKLLSGYKLYVDDVLINLGPGRGEAPVWGGDGAFRALPIATVDLTAALAEAGVHALALQTMHKNPSVILEVVLTDAAGATVTVSTDPTWLAFNGDAHRKPGPPTHGSSAGTAFLEYIDARGEPVGWRQAGFAAGADWAPAVATAPSPSDQRAFHPRMQPPLVVADIAVTSIVPVPASSRTHFLADFGREFQGGLRLSVTDGVAGTTVAVMCGESLQGGTTVADTWGWEFTWTLRDGAQVLEQHKYLECRHASLVFSAPAPTFTLSAWRVNYPWVDTDSSFTSSNATLNAVYELCRYTLLSAALDTYTDSNTRERTPYEADGMIAATGRIMLQRDFLWPRHSHAFVIQNPTWPVEWQQLSAYLGWQDYMATGQPDLALAFMDIMHNRTQVRTC